MYEDYQRQAQEMFKAHNRRAFRRAQITLVTGYVGLVIGLVAFASGVAPFAAVTIPVGHHPWWLALYLPVDTALLVGLLLQWHAALHRYEDARQMLTAQIAVAVPVPWGAQPNVAPQRRDLH